MGDTNWKRLYQIALILGIALRLLQYLDNRNLWLDEAMLALNILDKPFTQLFLPLEYRQAAPVLFLLLEKAAVLVFGPSEYALRLLPLLLSLLTLPLIYRLALRWTQSPLAAILALWMVAASPFLVRYASEVKQYTVDAFVGLLLLWAAERRVSEGRTDWTTVLLGIALVFLSHITGVILATLLLYYGYEYARRRRAGKPTEVWMVLAPAAVWVLALGAFYIFFVKDHPTQAAMAAYWKFGFAPAGPFNGEFWTWLRFSTIDILSNLFFYSSPGTWWAEQWLLQFLLLGGIFAAGWRKQYKLLFFTLIPVASLCWGSHSPFRRAAA